MSPTFSESLRQPFRNRALGAPPSTPQFVTLPVSSLTSMKTQMWGLPQSTLRHRPLQRDRLVAVELGVEGVMGRSGLGQDERETEGER